MPKLANKGIVTDLVGRKVKPAEGRDTASVWTLQPHPESGQYYARIVAVWVEDGSAKALVTGPLGDMQELWLKHYELAGGANA